MEFLVSEKKGVREIARLLGRDPGSVCRHLKDPENLGFVRHKKVVRKQFCAKHAMQRQAAKKRGRGAKSKIGKDPWLKEYLEEKIKKKWSPQMAIGFAKKHKMFEKLVSVKTVYNTIYRCEMAVDLFDLRLKLRRKPSKEKRTRVWKRIYGKRIDERPDISGRTEFGHWECDTVLWGANCSVLTMAERKSRYCKLVKLERHTADEVNAKMAKLNLRMKTLTADNGCEFAKLSDIFADTYFTHPYSSWEKGSVENLNGILRWYLPRGTNPAKITQAKLDEIAEQINALPRPLLDFASAAEVYSLNAP